MVFADSVDRRDQSEILKRKIAVLSRSASDQYDQRRKAENTGHGIGAVMQDETKAFPCKKLVFEEPFQLEIPLRLFFIHIHALSFKDVLDKIGKEKLLAADLIRTVPNLLDVVRNISAGNQRSSSSSPLGTTTVFGDRSSWLRIARHCLLYMTAPLTDGLSLTYSLPVAETDG